MITNNGVSPEALDLLGGFFPANELKSFILTQTKDKKKGMAAFYVDNRAIMNRLDAVCGHANWRNEFAAGPSGGVICGISIRINGEWITKWDGADNTAVEATKGGLSTSMRRAAVQWGIGRYLYEVEGVWVPVKAQGKSYVAVTPPRIPAKYLPEDNSKKKKRAASVPSAQVVIPEDESDTTTKQQMTAKQLEKFQAVCMDETGSPKNRAGATRLFNDFNSGKITFDELIEKALGL